MGTQGLGDPRRQKWPLPSDLKMFSMNQTSFACEVSPTPPSTSMQGLWIREHAVGLEAGALGTHLYEGLSFPHRIRTGSGQLPQPRYEFEECFYCILVTFSHGLHLLRRPEHPLSSLEWVSWNHLFHSQNSNWDPRASSTLLGPLECFCASALCHLGSTLCPWNVSPPLLEPGVWPWCWEHLPIVSIEIKEFFPVLQSMIIREHDKSQGAERK